MLAACTVALMANAVAVAAGASCGLITTGVGVPLSGVVTGMVEVRFTLGDKGLLAVRPVVAVSVVVVVIGTGVLVIAELALRATAVALASKKRAVAVARALRRTAVASSPKVFVSVLAGVGVRLMP